MYQLTCIFTIVITIEKLTFDPSHLKVVNFKAFRGDLINIDNKYPFNALISNYIVRRRYITRNLGPSLQQMWRDYNVFIRI